MLRRIHHRLASDDGLTLVEMLVALVILMITILALTSTLITSLRAMYENEVRVRANALANELLEELQAQAWNELGAGTETSTESRGGVTYAISTDIEWVDDESTADADDYLQFTVTLTWETFGRERSVTHSAYRSPPLVDPSPLAIRSLQVEPEVGFIEYKVPGDSANGRIMQSVSFGDDGQLVVKDISRVELVLRLTEPRPNAKVEVEFTDRFGNTRPYTLKTLDGGTTWGAEVLSSGERYVNGDTTFRFTISETIDGEESTVSVTKLARYVHKDVVADEGPEATPAQVCLDADRRGKHPVELKVHFRGLTIDDDVEVTGAGLNEPGTASYVGGEATTRGSFYTYTLQEGHLYPEGSTTTVTLTGARAFSPDFSGVGTVDLELLEEDAC